MRNELLNKYHVWSFLWDRVCVHVYTSDELLKNTCTHTAMFILWKAKQHDRSFYWYGFGKPDLFVYWEILVTAVFLQLLTLSSPNVCFI